MGNETMRQAMAEHMTKSLRKNVTAIGHVLHIDFPEWADNDTDKISYLFAMSILAIREKSTLQSPAMRLSNEIKRAEAEGNPISVIEQDIMSVDVLPMLKFWRNTNGTEFFNVLWDILYCGTTEDFESILRGWYKREECRYVLEHTSEQAKVLLEEHNRIISDSDDKKYQRCDLLEFKWKSLTEPYRADLHKAKAAWDAFGVKDVWELPEDCRYQAIKAHSDYVNAKYALDVAGHTLCPEYYEAVASTYDSADIFDADGEYEKALAELKHDAEKEFAKIWSKKMC